MSEEHPRFLDAESVVQAESGASQTGLRSPDRHTPGPWSVGFEGYNACSIYGAGGDQQGICQVYGLPMNIRVEHVSVKYAQGMANARLISAAPDMLEALETVVQFWGEHDAWGDFASLTSAAGKFAPVADKARAAIAKARG